MSGKKGKTAMRPLMLLLATLDLLNAFELKRSGSWEAYLGGQYVSGERIDFDGGAKADLNDRAAFLFGFGYNFDNHLNLGAMFGSSSANYRGTSVCPETSKECTPGETETFTASMYTSQFNLTGTYNFMEGKFTPFVQGNLGFTYIDSGSRSGDGYCYWDPWWGYQCYGTNYTETRFNYGAQVGLRYELGYAAFIKAGVGLNYIDLSHATNPGFTVYNLVIGMKFK
ncbi:MAG TPA: hypothetical protein ENL04_04615 [Sulfuricurvum sp.]|nr:hypothetical protein [Sulfuricurvum sp.]